jgi:hypothetical protein
MNEMIEERAGELIRTKGKFNQAVATKNLQVALASVLLDWGGQCLVVGINHEHSE